MNQVKPRKAGSPHDAVHRLIAQAGGAEQAADFVGRKASTVYGWTDPDICPNGAPVNLLAQLTEHYRASAMAEYFASLAGGVFMPVPEGDTTELHEIGARTAEDAGRMMADLHRDLSPASDDPAGLTAAEGEEMLADCDRLLRHVMQLRSVAYHATRHGRKGPALRPVRRAS